jgi:7-cyano-7-deazaguanine synthase
MKKTVSCFRFPVFCKRELSGAQSVVFSEGFLSRKPTKYASMLTSITSTFFLWATKDYRDRKEKASSSKPLKYLQKTENRKQKTAFKPLAVVLLSGGLDSCVAAAVARQDYELALFHANYGQRALSREWAAFRALAAFFQARLTLEADFNFLGQIGGSSLTDERRPIPTDAAEPPGIPSTYVPFRNSVLLSAAVAWAEVLGAEAVFIGANFLDNPGYPDCRPEYFEVMNRLIELGTRPETTIRIHTPLIGLDKAGIIRLGLKLGAPLNLTWSCYLEGAKACGRCSSCRLRLQGFAAAGVPDPIPYQD